MITVLLSAYNGTEYLTEQLDSIRLQEGIDIRLLVRDDGSTDNGATLALLEEYQALHPEFDMAIIKGKNIGWAKSFMQLVYDAPESDYYAFCDQDDIWLPDKLKSAVELLRQQSEGCCLYYSNLYYYQNGINKHLIEHPDKNIVNKPMAVMRNLATGCTCVFDNKLRQLLCESRKYPFSVEAHDMAAFLVAVFLGKVVFDHNSYILYRQHENNQIGSKGSFIDLWKRRIKEVRKEGLTHIRENRARWLMQVYGDKLTAEDIDLLKQVTNYRKNPVARTRLLFSNKFKMETSKSTILSKIRVLIGNF